MTGKRVAFAAKPPSAERWIAERAEPSGARRRAEIYSARLTIDVTPALRGRIKLAAFHRGTTAARLLRELLETSFPEPEPSP
jgi:hypothetical protein